MQKLIIIRGHSGSGKSTFARQQINQFQQQFPNAKIFHIENDNYLIENGEYIWTEQRFQQAKTKAYQYLNYGFRWCKTHSERNALIVISNVGINTAEIDRTLQKATALGMSTNIYRMMSFYENTHNVSQETAISMFNALNDNPINGEIQIYSDFQP